VLALSPGPAERHGFVYYRHGTEARSWRRRSHPKRSWYLRSTVFVTGDETSRRDALSKWDTRVAEIVHGPKSTNSYKAWAREESIRACPRQKPQRRSSALRCASPFDNVNSDWATETL